MVTTLMNLLLQFIEGLIFFEFYESISPSGKKLKSFAFTEMLYILIGLINEAFDFNLAVNVITFIIVHTILTKFIYKMKLQASAFFTVTGIALVLITEVGVSELIKLTAPLFIINDYGSQSSYLLLILLSKSALFASLKIISSILGKFSKNLQFRLSLLIYPISLIIGLYTIYIVCAYANPPKHIGLLIFGSCIILVAGVITTCILIQDESRKTQELLELKAQNQEQEINTSYFKLLEYQNDNLMVYAHDTKKHLNAIRELTDDDKIIEYISRLTDSLNEYKKLYSSGNRNLDVILNKYDAECKLKGVNFNCDTRLSNLKNIDAFDLVAILNNSLDNALEAAVNSKEKYVDFQTDHRNTYDVLIIKNSCDKSPVSVNEELKTTKEDKELHGYGMKSLKATVKKYNGDYIWEYSKEKKEFTLTISLLRK